MRVKGVDRIISPTDTRVLVSEWLNSPAFMRHFEPLWAALRTPNDLKPSFLEFEQYKQEVQLACSPVPASIFPPTHQNFEKFGARFNEGCVWSFGDRQIFLFLIFSEYDVSIASYCWPKP